MALFALSFCLCGVLRCCCMGLMTARNPGVLQEAIAHRRRAKVHDYSLPGNPFYAYDETNVRNQSISGVGPQLFFRFVIFIATLCFLLVALLVLGYFLPKMAFIPKERLGLIMAVFACVFYGLYWLAVVCWMCCQDSIVRADVEEEPHLRNYALVSEGYPKSARSPHEVKAYFESILGFEIEGVSITYDYVEEQNFIADRLGRIVETADTHLGVYPSELAGIDPERHAASQDSHLLDCLMNAGYAFVVFSREEDREFCSRRFAEIDRQVKQGLHRISDKDSSDSDEEEKVSLLNGAGRAKRQHGGASRAVLFRGKFPIRVGSAPEPSGIQWRNFAVRRGAKAIGVAITLLVVLMLVAVFGAVMFAPAVLFEMTYLDIRNPNSGQWMVATVEQGIVSASIAIGNYLLVCVLAWAAARSGFLQQVNEDSVLVVCAFFATLLNSTVPLIIASIVARSEDMTITRRLTVAWLFQILWMCMVVNEVLACFLPSWAYWGAYFWIRNSKYASVRESEPLMASLEFPLAARYVDMLLLLALLCVMVAVYATSLYTIAAHCLMLAYSIYVFFVDKYRFLRVNRHTYYMSSKLDSTVHYLFVVMIGILSVFPLRQPYFSTRKPWTTWYPWVSICIFVVNIFFWPLVVWVSQKCNEPHRELSDVPYVEVASLTPYNYFNLNPVHVLRTLHFPSIVVPPVYPYLPGKEYLHGGQFADYDDSVRLRETLMLLVKMPLKGIDG